MDDILIDKRVIERQIRKGKLDEKEHRRSLASLPDSSDRVARSAPEAQMTHAPSMSVGSAAAASAAVAPQASSDPTSDVDDDDDLDDDDDDDADDDDAPADAVL